MLITEVMSRPTLQLSNNATVQEAAKMMARSASNALIVVDSIGRFVGMIDEETILSLLLPDMNEIFALGGSVNDAHALFLQKGSRSAQRSIEPFIRTDLITLHPESHIGEAALIFMEQPYCFLPVVEQGMLLGAVTRAAVCCAATRRQQSMIQLACERIQVLWQSTSRRCREWSRRTGERLRLPQSEPLRETA